MIAKGKYRARCIEHQFGIAETGTDQIGLCFEILEEGPFRGQTITWFGFFTEAAANQTFKTLRACGWEGDDLATVSGLDRNEVEIEIVHESRDGKVTARVKWVNRAGGGGIAMKHQMTDAQRAALAAKYKAFAVATKPKASGSARPAAGGGGYPSQWDQNDGL